MGRGGVEQVTQNSHNSTLYGRPEKALLCPGASGSPEFGALTSVYMNIRGTGLRFGVFNKALGELGKGSQRAERVLLEQVTWGC